MSQDIKQRFEFPWYRQGLRFSCTQCGKCCTGSSGLVWISEEEISQMAQFLNISISTFKRLYVRHVDQRYVLVEKKSQNYSCIFYYEKKCKVYAARPLQCRAYPFWQENLLSEKSWQHTTQECEGIHDEGTLISYEEIENFLKSQQQQNPQEYFVSSNQ